MESHYEDRADDPAEELDDYSIQAKSGRLVRSYCTERYICCVSMHWFENLEDSSVKGKITQAFARITNTN